MATTHRATVSVLTIAAAGVLIDGLSTAQSFSIDYRGPTITVPSPTPITAADILVPTPPGAPGFAPPALPVPFVGVGGGFIPAPSLGIPSVPGCVGAPPGAMCPAEVDALSWGTDFVPVGGGLSGTWVFSVDEFAVGIPGSPLAPNVVSEAPCFDHSADVFAALNLPAGPIPPPAGPPVPGNSGLLDGNGFMSPCGGRYIGLGIVEPRPAFPGFGPRPGDNLDALDMDRPPVPYTGAYFSLDSGFGDPCYGVPNTGTAAANGTLPGAILFAPAGGPVGVWAAPPFLGLDLLGPGTDDLDALVLLNAAPFAFGPGDFVRFSVRRGSAVIGLPDSNFGAPIEAGDILMPPPAPGMPPGIFIPAELLGLATVRTGTAFVCVGGPQGDELDALDTRPIPTTAFAYCFGDGSGPACPCLNTGGNGNGCGNPAFPGGANLGATGAASVSGDTVLLTSTGMSGLSSLYFQGTGQAAIPFGYGINCLSGALIRVGLKTNVGGTSTNPSGIDLPLSVKGGVPPAGATRFYQTVYRQVMPACAPPPLSLTNRTNGLAIVWTP
ncbi:MAG: hypothetical protein ACKVWV_18010 [Planctomycetota bacterium]